MKKFLVILMVVAMASLLFVGCIPTVPVAVTGVTLDQATMTLTAGGATGTLVATVAPADASNTSVTWSSSATTVATVADGVVTPLTAGTADITVTTVDGRLTATCTVTVSAAPAVTVAVTGVTLDKATLALVAGGATGTLVETILPADATNPSVTWASSAPAVATVAAGVVTPLTVGITVITVTTVDGSFTDTCIVTVSATPIAVTGVTLDEATLALTVGDAAVTLVATVAPATATETSVTWASSVPAVATVALGVVTPLTAGTTTIMVTTVDGDFFDTCVVTVTAAPATVAVTGVTLDEATLALTVGDAAVTLVATVAPATATDTSVIWASSDETVAIVALGVVTPLNAGISAITVTTVDGGFVATCVVTVTAADEPEPVLPPSTAPVIEKIANVGDDEVGIIDLYSSATQYINADELADGILVKGVAPKYSEVNVYVDDEVVGTGTAYGVSETFTVFVAENNLGDDGAKTLYATATEVALAESAHSTEYAFTLDTIAPEIASAVADSGDDFITVTFDEAVDEDTVETAVWEVGGIASDPTFETAELTSDNEVVKLNLDAEIITSDVGDVFTVSCSAIGDLAENVSDELFTYGIVKP